MGFLLFVIAYLTFAAISVTIILIFYSKRTTSIVNSDTFMRKFVFKVNFPPQEILRLLSTRNVNDNLNCTLNAENTSLIFSDVSSSREYYISIVSMEDWSLLRVYQVALIGSKSSVPYKLNSFIINKLNAEPIPFSKYPF